MRGLRLGLGLTGGGPSFDYYVDSVNGSDTNNGTSLATAWKSLSKISSIPLPANSAKRVLVKAGTYSTASDFVVRHDSSSGGAVGAGATLNITFEAGCVMDGTLANASSAINGFEFAGTVAWTANVYGNGLTIQHYNYNIGGASSNGLGNRDGHTLNAYNVVITDCVDGVSAHDSAKINLYDSNVTGGTKSAYAHIGTTQTHHYRCTFTGTSGATLGIGSIASTASALFDHCKFVPASTSQSIDVTNSTFTTCQMGTLTATLAVTGTGGSVSDCFVNAFVDGNKGITLLRCFGKFSTRVRNGSGAINVQHSVFSAPATGKTSIIYSDFDPGSSAKLVFKNNIVETATGGAFMSVDSINAGYLVAAGSELDHNILSGSAAFDADYVTADSTGTGRAGTVTADALIGAANTLLMADYGYVAGSPAIGAASDGSNSGFAVSEAVTVGA